jgi:hypothetical protein
MPSSTFFGEAVPGGSSPRSFRPGRRSITTSAAEAGASPVRPRSHSQRWGHGQPVSQDHGKGGSRGYDGGKKVKGRKRHLLVDTQGLLLKVKVHEAGIHDKEGAKLLLAPLAGHFPRMVKVWVDYAYRGLRGWLRETLGWEVEVVKH